MFHTYLCSLRLFVLSGCLFNAIRRPRSPIAFCVVYSSSNQIIFTHSISHPLRKNIARSVPPHLNYFCVLFPLSPKYFLRGLVPSPNVFVPFPLHSNNFCAVRDPSPNIVLRSVPPSLKSFFVWSVPTRQIILRGLFPPILFSHSSSSSPQIISVLSVPLPFKRFPQTHFLWSVPLIPNAFCVVCSLSAQRFARSVPPPFNCFLHGLFPLTSFFFARFIPPRLNYFLCGLFPLP